MTFRSSIIVTFVAWGVAVTILYHQLGFTRDFRAASLYVTFIIPAGAAMLDYFVLDRLRGDPNGA